jgi:hypothetical protein
LTKANQTKGSRKSGQACGRAEVERYTRAADQERLARQAMQRQSENRSGKLPVDEVANTTDQTLEINSLIARLALPRGLEPLFSP